MKAIEKRGEAPTWGFFGLGDKAFSDLEQKKHSSSLARTEFQ